MREIIIITLVMTIYSLPLDAVASQHNHGADMQRLIEFCKIHTKDECHELHARMHMKHHGGTKEDFQKHYEKEHGQKKGPPQKNAY